MVSLSFSFFPGSVLKSVLIITFGRIEYPDMANPKGAPEQYRFKPGNPGGGRPKGLIRRDDIEAAITKFWKMTKAEVQAIIENPKATMGDLMIASVIAKAIDQGDQARVAFLLDRLVGKVKEVSEITVTKPYIVEKLDGGVLELGAGAPEEEEAKVEDG